MTTTTNSSQLKEQASIEHDGCLDIKNDSKCYATENEIRVVTWVSNSNYKYKCTFLIKSDSPNKKHSILCLISDETDIPVLNRAPKHKLEFTVRIQDILLGTLNINENDQLGIIVFNDLPNDFQLGYLEAIRNHYSSIFLFDAEVPDVDGRKLNDVINDYQKIIGIMAPKEGQGGVIISGG